jgi:hypothetical protein
MGVFAQPLALVHEGRSRVLVALSVILSLILSTLTPRERLTDMWLIVGTFHALSYNESEEARPTARLSDQDARTLAGFSKLLASLHEGHEFSLIHNPGIWQKIHCSIAHMVHNSLIGKPLV